MANLDLYIDTVRGIPVASFDSSSSVDLPPIVQGDTLSMRIWLMTHASTYPVTPFEFIPNTDITLQVAIGTKQGTGGTLYTQQFTWTANTDAANPYFSAQLPLNTDAINSLIGTSDQGSAWLEVKYIKSGVPTTVLSKQVGIQAAVIHNDSVTVPAGLTPLSAEAANALFLQRLITGPITLQNGTGQAVSIYVGADGTFHADPIS